MKKLIIILIVILFMGCKAVFVFAPHKQKVIEVKVNSKDSIKTTAKPQNIESHTNIKL